MERTSEEAQGGLAAKRARLSRATDVRHEHPDPQKPHDTRSEFERDRSRILHAEAFRRLQAKTQVFYGVHGASYRTRLTHSMEVALIAKALANRFGADPDLCEAVALAHDLGHPPFGHNGEAVLNECMAEHGGFEGNAQTLRIVRRLEAKGYRYHGLNLTFATLDGILKYKIPYSEAARRASPPASGERLPMAREISDDARDLAEATAAPKCVYDDDWDLVEAVVSARGTESDESFECRLMNLADDIAYCVADLQDGLAMGFLSMAELRIAARGEGIVDEVYAFLSARSGRWKPETVVARLRELVALFERIDAKSLPGPPPSGEASYRSAATAKELASKLHREFVHAVSLGPDGLPFLAPTQAEKIAVLKAVTRTQILQDVRLTTLDAASRKVVRRLFEAYACDPKLLPRDVGRLVASDALRDSERLRVVCDHVASMTDDSALQAYRRLYEPGSQGLLDFV